MVIVMATRERERARERNGIKQINLIKSSNDK